MKKGMRLRQGISKYRWDRRDAEIKYEKGEGVR